MQDNIDLWGGRSLTEVTGLLKSSNFLCHDASSCRGPSLFLLARDIEEDIRHCKQCCRHCWTQLTQHLHTCLCCLPVLRSGSKHSACGKNEAPHLLEVVQSVAAGVGGGESRAVFVAWQEEFAGAAQCCSQGPALGDWPGAVEPCHCCCWQCCRGGNVQGQQGLGWRGRQVTQVALASSQAVCRPARPAACSHLPAHHLSILKQDLTVAGRVESLLRDLPS